MKNWYVFLVSLLFSLGIWLAMNLSRVNSDVESVPVYARVSIEGYSEESAEAVEILARCKASGFKLLDLSRRKTVRVAFSSEDFTMVSPGIFEISSASLYKYANDIFGSGVTVESFLNSKFSFRFLPENCAKFPVKVVKYVRFRPQYTAESEMTVSPDSVWVYGTPERLSTLDYVVTESFSLDDAHRDIHNSLALKVPSGLRVSPSEVVVSQKVCRFVELKRTCPLVVKNLPDGADLLVYPSSVELRVRCAYPVSSETVENVSAYIDYEDFVKSRSGACLVRIDAPENSVLSCEAEPSVAECVEK